MKNKTPSPDDLSLWQQAMRDVKRLFAGSDTSEKIKPVAPSPKPASVSPPLSAFSPEIRLAPFPSQESRAADTGGLDRRTEDKFRKGKMPLEGRLDLHGLTLREAHAAVRDYILLQSAAGKRCVLIITGKGSGAQTGGSFYDPPKGQIRQNLTHWLNAPNLRPLILSTAPAQRAHGGDGAFYILLRRQRD